MTAERPPAADDPSAGRAPCDDVDVLAVVGSDPVRRARVAARVARNAGRALFPAARLSMSPDPVDEAVGLVPWAGEQGAVLELPTTVDVTDLIGAFAHARLTAVVCVLDARTVRAGLAGDRYLRRRAPEGLVEHVAAAVVLANQIEYASEITLEHWRSVPPVELAQVLALLGHLAPTAEVHLWSGHPPVGFGGPGTTAYGAAQERPGWVAILNGDPVPSAPGSGVGFVHYEQVRPFHPGRLALLLDDVEQGRFGTVVRSAGLCRLATRPATTLRWEHVGAMLALLPAGCDDEDELVALGQDLAFIGLDLDPGALVQALDAAALDDEELLAGPGAWSMMDEPAALCLGEVDGGHRPS